MQLTREPFGRAPTGEMAELFTLMNDSGSYVKLTNCGGIITDIVVPDRYGKLVNVVLGFDHLAEYFSDTYLRQKPYFGAIVGRFANRIGGGRMTLGGRTFKVSSNLGKHMLHGGFKGFDQKIWHAEGSKTRDFAELRLSRLSPHLEEGFPGNLNVAVIYRWDNLNALHIMYSAETDQPTHVNLTNHSYFNLNGGAENILGHRVQILAGSCTEVDADAIPTGRLIDVDPATTDFRVKHPVGERIGRLPGSGYDYNYVVDDFDGSLKPVASADDPASGINLEVLTTEPGVQFFTANHLDGKLSRGDIAFPKYAGLCFETQHFPDSPNHPGFPSTLLKPGELFRSETVYRFTT